jgi:hypothetical protein
MADKPWSQKSTQEKLTTRFPDADVRIDSEADSDYLAKYDVSDGQILVLVEGS